MPVVPLFDEILIQVVVTDLKEVPVIVESCNLIEPFTASRSTGFVVPIPTLPDLVLSQLGLCRDCFSPLLVAIALVPQIEFLLRLML